MNRYCKKDFFSCFRQSIFYCRGFLSAGSKHRSNLLFLIAYWWNRCACSTRFYSALNKAEQKKSINTPTPPPSQVADYPGRVEQAQRFHQTGEKKPTIRSGIEIDNLPKWRMALVPESLPTIAPVLFYLHLSINLYLLHPCNRLIRLVFV